MDTSMVLSSVACRPRASTFDPRQTFVQDFDMSLSLLSASNLAYPMNYTDTNLGYHFEAAQVLRPNPFYRNTAQQPFFVAPSYTLAQDIPEVREARNAVANVGGSPVIKAEDGSSAKDAPAFGDFSTPNSQTPLVGQGIEFGTDVDTLMRAIQTKSARRPQKAQNTVGFHSSGRRTCDSETLLRRHANGLEAERSNQASRKKYTCTVPSCTKMFFQKTHLEIHLRAHTGCKPFLCKESSCGQRFSQLGNLKTHERRHTGERPYSCELCGKRFAQRGNVRAHRIVHEQTKPFSCKLEGCGKHFTQLGNLKSHQNKFHSETLRNLTLRFASMREGDAVSATDKELWEYFATLYKNSNKGIKGRGKDRRIFANSRGENNVKEESRSRSRSSSSSSSSRVSAGTFDTGREKYEVSSSSSVENDEQDGEYPIEEALAKARQDG